MMINLHEIFKDAAEKKNNSKYSNKIWLFLDHKTPDLMLLCCFSADTNIFYQWTRKSSPSKQRSNWQHQFNFVFDFAVLGVFLGDFCSTSKLVLTTHYDVSVTPRL